MSQASIQLDQQIADSFSLLGLLLVFVIGFFSALWPRVEDLIGQPRPEPDDDRLALARRLLVHRKLFVALIVLSLAVVSLLAPISVQAIAHLSAASGFPTIKAGLLFVDVLLLAVAGIGLYLSGRLKRRAEEVSP